MVVELVAMKTTGTNEFLPRVNECPRIVMTTAVGRALQTLYAPVVEEHLPGDLASMVRRLDQGAQTQR
jgi:hypothetical protein